MEQIDYIRLVYLSLLAIAIGGLVFAQFKGRIGEALRITVTWAMIFIGVIAAYGLWDDIRNAASPSYIIHQTDNTVALRRQPDGHFYANATVNGQGIRFLVDTGATSIVLSRNDAALAGFKPDRLNYSGRASTANGTVKTAPVRIDNFQLGNIASQRLPASVNNSSLDVSLLGQSYLSRFNRVIIDGDIMTLQLE